jgi:hypothetical protein
VGFAPSIFFWILGTAFLSIATGAWFALKKTHRAKVFVVAVPLILLIPSYYVQVTLARGGTLIPPGETLLKTVLDIAYPFGDFLALTFAAVVWGLSYKYFGGVYRRSVTYLLLGLAVMYFADSVFSLLKNRKLLSVRWLWSRPGMYQILSWIGIIAMFPLAATASR